MANWQQANLSAIVPSELNSLISTAETTVSTVGAVLDAIKAAIDVIKSFLIPIPNFDFASALIIAVEKFREDFLGTGFYSANMWDFPLRQYYRSGIAGENFVTSFEDELVSSFADSQDPNVPPFNSSAAMLVLVGGAPGTTLLEPIVEGISLAFSWWAELKAVDDSLKKLNVELEIKNAVEAIIAGDIKGEGNDSQRSLLLQKLNRALRDLRERISPEDLQEIIDAGLIPNTGSSVLEIENFIAAVNTSVGTSAYPDWQQISLRQIVPPIPDVVDQVFDPLIAALQTGRNILETVESIVEALEAKIDSLNSVIDRIEEYLSLLDALINATGLFALWVETSDGVSGLASELRAAGNKPFDNLDNGFYFGVALVAGSAGLTPFTNLFKPLGAS